MNMKKFILIPCITGGRVIIYLVFIMLILQPLPGMENEDNDQINNSPRHEVLPFFLPAAGVQVDGKMFENNESGYSMETRRIIDINLLKINRFVFSTYINEIMVFDGSPGSPDPGLIRYEMRFGSLSMEFEYGILSLFFDHDCVNIINEEALGDRRVRWYGAGLQWESYGMRPGRKNTDKENNPWDIDFLNSLNYSISAKKRLHTRVLDYDYIFNGILRYNIFSYNIVTPYIEGSLTTILNSSVRTDRYLETGIRFTFNKWDITPFAGIQRNYDTDNSGTSQYFYFGGLRMEALVGKTGNEAQANAPVPDFPDFHFRGSYGKFINDEYLNFNTDILIEIDFFSSNTLYPFISTRLVHNSLREDAGLFPRYMQTDYEAGISARIDLINALIEPCYKYGRFDESNFYNGYSGRFHAAEIRLKSRGMKTGFGEENIDGVPYQINRFNWLVSAGRIIKESYYNYTWEYNIILRWDICRYKYFTPYVTGSICLLRDDDYDKIYSLEPGLRISSGLYWMLFYRFEYRTAVDPGDGLYKHFHLLGLRIEI